MSESSFLVSEAGDQEPLVDGPDLSSGRDEVEYHSSREVHQYETCERVSQVLSVTSVGLAAHFDLEDCHSIRRDGKGSCRSIELLRIIEHMHLVMLAGEGVHGEGKPVHPELDPGSRLLPCPSLPVSHRTAENPPFRGLNLPLRHIIIQHVGPQHG